MRNSTLLALFGCLIVAGSKKAGAVKTALTAKAAPGEFPAQMVKPVEGGQLVWLLDDGAAAQLMPLPQCMASIGV